MRKWLAAPVTVGIVLVSAFAFAGCQVTSPLSTQELAWDTSSLPPSTS